MVTSGTISIEDVRGEPCLLVRVAPGAPYGKTQLTNGIRRTIPGSRFMNAAGGYVVRLGRNGDAPSPFLIDGIKELMTKWGFELRTDDRLKHLLVLWERQEKRYAGPPHSINGKLNIPGMTGEDKLFAAQVDGVLYLQDRKRALLADAVGSGKTVQAFSSLALLDAMPCIVVCTQTMKLQLADELRLWFKDKAVCILAGRPKAAMVVEVARWWMRLEDRGPEWRTLAEKERYFDATQINTFKVENTHKLSMSMASLHTADAIFLNYDIAAAWMPLLQTVGVKGLICDESQRLRGLNTQRTKALRALAEQIPVRYLLTGTPVVNRPLELLPQLQILGRIEEFGGSFYYLMRYCQGPKTKFGQQWTGAHRLDELRSRLTRLCMINRPRKAFRPDALEPVIQHLAITLDNQEEYERAELDVARWFVGHIMEGDVDAWLAEQRRRFPDDAARLKGRPAEEELQVFLNMAQNRILAAEALQRIIHLRMVAGRGKIWAAKEWIADFLESDRKLVVFAVHKEIQKGLIAALQAYEPATLVAEHDPDARAHNIKRFQKDPRCRLIISSLAVGGEGVTLTAASDVLFTELGWTPMEMLQGLGRVDRIGQHEPVNAYWLKGQLAHGEECIDTWLVDLLKGKSEVVAKIMGEAPLPTPQGGLAYVMQKVMDRHQR